MKRTVHLRIRRLIADPDVTRDPHGFSESVREHLATSVSRMPPERYSDAATITHSVGDAVRRAASGVKP